jgi:wyosine [tRNA(Phe)-imidazoG37] synthetase (radical SAM superfamily)
MTGGFKYIYGPVSSWRLGRSLGVDPLSKEEKVCSFDCTYCQIGETNQLQVERDVFVTPLQIIGELLRLPDVAIDYITFSGRGEPTLAANLASLIRAVREVRDEKVAVITNSSLMSREEVRADLMGVDLVVAKLDASTEECFQRVNRPAEGLHLEDVVKGLKEFRSSYSGKLALQIMFQPENRNEAEGIAGLSREIEPDEVQLNTPLRPCAVVPLSPEEMEKIGRLFSGSVISVYEAEMVQVRSVSGTDTLTRRGKVAHQ